MAHMFRKLSGAIGGDRAGRGDPAMSPTLSFWTLSGIRSPDVEATVLDDRVISAVSGQGEARRLVRNNKR